MPLWRALANSLRLLKCGSAPLTRPEGWASLSDLLCEVCVARPVSSGVYQLLSWHWFRFAVHHWLSQAALRRQMADVVHNPPDFLVAQNTLGARHSRREDAVVYDPLQLAIAIRLN